MISCNTFWKKQEPADNKAPVYKPLISMVIGIFLALRRSRVGSILIPRNLHNIRVCVNLALDKYKHLELVWKSKHRPKIWHRRYCWYLWQLFQRHQYEGLHYFQTPPPPKYGKLILNGRAVAWAYYPFHSQTCWQKHRIYSSIYIEVSQYQHQFILNPRVENLECQGSITGRCW